VNGIDTVLVPVDFSKPSAKALKYGLSLAVELESRLVLAHVLPFSEPMGYAYPFPVEELEPSKADEIKAKMEAMIPEDLKNFVKARFVLRTGEIDDNLIEIASEESADLIVMGTHGRRRFERWLLGSVTERMLRHAGVPVLTVSHLDREHDIAEPQPVPLRKIMYATDLVATPDRGMETALNLAGRFSADLLVVHVMRELRWAYGAEGVPLDIETTSVEVRDGLITRLEASVPESSRHDPRVRTELLEGQPYEKILETAEREDVDLIVLNTRSRSGLDRALLGSTAERIVRGAHVPVLSVPPED
jgi:nucleotide-binding universal stress UspA family protein